MSFANVSYICRMYRSRRTAQEWTNRTLAVRERANSRFLVLPGSLFIFTEITGH